MHHWHDQQPLLLFALKAIFLAAQMQPDVVHLHYKPDVVLLA